MFNSNYTCSLCRPRHGVINDDRRTRETNAATQVSFLLRENIVSMHVLLIICVKPKFPCLHFVWLCPICFVFDLKVYSRVQ